MSDWLTTRPIVHRGLHNDEFPENSLPAFQNAVDKNFPIELDVQMTTDGVLFVFHDYNAKIICNRDFPTKNIHSENLKDFHIKGSKDTIPRFEEVLKIVDGKVPLLIEIKNDGLLNKIEEALCFALEKYEGEFAIESFNPLSIRKIRKIKPNWIIGQLAGEFKYEKMPKLEKWILKNCCANFLSKPNFIAYDIRYLPKKHITVLKEKGVKILGWTVREQVDIQQAKKYCDNYIFE